MTIWILALVVVGAVAAIGYSQGAIRVGVSLIGILVAAALAIPLSPMVNWIFPLVRLRHPLFAQIFGPILTFILISVLFKVLAEFVHRKVLVYYKYQAEDTRRMLWEHLNRHLGACLGLINGTVYFVLICVLLALFGYFTVQVGAENSQSTILSWVGKAAADLKETRMDKVVAPFNPASKRYMDTADMAGLIYHNRALLPRLQLYPPFLVWEDRPEFVAMGKDAQLQGLLKNDQDIHMILTSPNLWTVVTNVDYAAELKTVDFEDLREYLLTGRSPKYDPERILGRWRYSHSATLVLTKRHKPTMSASEYYRTKEELQQRYRGSFFTAKLNHQADVTLPAAIEGTIPPISSNAPPRFSSTGEWKGSAPNYQVTLKNKNNLGGTSDVAFEANRIHFVLDGNQVAFEKVEP